MQIPFSPPDLCEDDISVVAEVLRSGWITTGPKTKEFERKLSTFCKTQKTACLNSATAGLELTLRLLGIGDGDEVITTAYTYTASASVVCHVGARLILVDTQKDSFEIDYDQVAAAITPRTKAIIAVDLAGIIFDYTKLFQIAEDHMSCFSPKTTMQETLGRIAIIGDAAHSFGAVRDGVRCGGIADFTVFSFHAVKNLTCAEGGAVTWKPFSGLDDETIYTQYQLMSLHGQSKDALSKTELGSWEYDIVAPYYKCNMTDIMAALGLSQLARYEKTLACRKELIEQYDALLQSDKLLRMKHYTTSMTSSGHLYLVRIAGANESTRNNIINSMASHGVSCNVHYKPLPLLSAYRNLGFDISDYPNAYMQYENEISLPLHTLLTKEQVRFIAQTLLRSIEENVV